MEVTQTTRWSLLIPPWAVCLDYKIYWHAEMYIMNNNKIDDDK